MVSRSPRRQHRLLLRALRGRKAAMAAVGRALGHARRADQVFMIVTAIVIGLLGGAGAIGFRFLIKLCHGAFFFSFDRGLEAAQSLPWWARLLIPAAGGLLVGPLVRFVAPEVRGSGVPEVMESVAFRGGFIRARVVLAKALAAALTIGSGGSAGREGPIVQVGSSVGSLLGQLMSVNPQRLRTFVGCGAAAGIAATFNAPIAGALFAVEVILGEFALMHFSPIVISSVTATVLSRHFLGDFPAFEVPDYELLRAAEFLPYAALGIGAGLTSVLFIWLVYRSQDLFDSLPAPLWVKPAVGGLLVGGIAVALPEVLGVGYDTLNHVLWNRFALLVLVLLIPAKMVATSATLGSGGSGGVFAPSLFVGGSLGGAVGVVAGAWMPGIASPGAYALVGMGAVVAGTTHGPISAILIIFELTGDYHIIPPLMVACILSVLLSSWIQPHSIYTLKLAKRGIDIHEGKDVNVLRSLRVGDYYDPDPEVLDAALDIHRVIDRMAHGSRETFFVCAADGRFLGAFSLHDLRELLGEQDDLPDLIVAADVARSDVPAVRPDDNLDLVMHLFGQHELEEVAVVARGPERRLLGSIRHKHVIEAYNKEIFRLDLTGGFHSLATATERERGVELLAGYRLVEVGVPYGFVGKTIRQIDVRRHYDVEIILIRKPSEADGGIPSRAGSFPSSGYVLRAEDRLLVLGTREAVRDFQNATPGAGRGRRPPLPGPAPMG